MIFCIFYSVNCSIVWRNVSKNKNTLFLLQNFACRVVVDLRNYDHKVTKLPMPKGHMYVHVCMVVNKCQ